MKKIALLLVTCMTVATIAVACGGNDDKKETTTKKTTTEKTTEATTEETTTEEPTTVPYDDTTVEASGWWVQHSKGFEVTADGVTVTFKTKTYDTASANWNTPIWVLFGADEAFPGGVAVNTVAGYAEYFVMRSDAYGWSGAAIPNADYVGGNTGADPVKGLVTVEGVVADDPDTADVNEADVFWAAWLAKNKEGVESTVTAKLDGTNAIVTIENNGVKTTATIPVDTSKTVYISLGGELCSLSEIAAQ